jgi:L-threonylcarbamoyladenylate synthase
MRMLQVDAETCTPAMLEEAAAWIRQGGVVAYPTDTWYGLGADVTSDRAVAAVFEVKGRGAEAALPLIAASLAQVEDLCGPLDTGAATLARAFWPGPLSIVLDAPASVSARAHAGLGSIAIRIPRHAVARALAAAFGAPIAATSANRAGEPPAGTAAELGSLADDARVFVVDGGPTPGGAPSTIVDMRGGTPRAIRIGAVPWNRVLRSLQA